MEETEECGGVFVVKLLANVFEQEDLREENI